MRVSPEETFAWKVLLSYYADQVLLDEVSRNIFCKNKDPDASLNSVIYDGGNIPCSLPPLSKCLLRRVALSNTVAALERSSTPCRL